MMEQGLNWLIDHTGIGVSDIYKAEAFYDAALGALGMRQVLRISDTRAAFKPGDRLGGVGYGVEFPIYWIDVFHPAGVQQHTAFRAKDRDGVHAFYRAALEAGGRGNGAPALRGEGYPPGYYAAFVLDPDGNNIEAVCREA